MIRFSPLDHDEATRLIREVHQIDADPQRIAEAVEIASGEIPAALRLLDESARRFRDSLVGLLSEPIPDPVAIRRVVNTRVDEAGKEAPKKRAALRDVFAIAVGHYRGMMRREAFESAVRPITLARLDRSVRAMRELDRMANLSTLVDCYAADVSIGQTGDRGDIGS